MHITILSTKRKFTPFTPVHTRIYEWTLNCISIVKKLLKKFGNLRFFLYLCIRIWQVYLWQNMPNSASIVRVLSVYCASIVRE